MMKKVFFSAIILLTLSNQAYAVLSPTNPASSLFVDVQTFGGGTFAGIFLTIINLILGLVGLISLLFLIIGGFRYVVAQGDERAIAAAKGTIFSAIIGLVIVLLSASILAVIYQTFT